jgi:hypothetical protein
MMTTVVLAIVSQAAGPGQLTASDISGRWTWTRGMTVGDLRVDSAGSYAHEWMGCFQAGEEAGDLALVGRVVRMSATTAKTVPAEYAEFYELRRLWYFAARDDTEFLVEESALPEFCGKQRDAPVVRDDRCAAGARDVEGARS